MSSPLCLKVKVEVNLLKIYYVLEISLGPTWKRESGGILWEIMQKFDEWLKEPGHYFAMDIISAVLKVWETRKSKRELSIISR